MKAAYDVMSEAGIDAAKIRDITDRADVGFGTFYNYFEDKDQLAAQVLDCVIDDFGRRNILATKGIGTADPALIMPVSMRLVMQAMIAIPFWHWWALRPDLLVDRMREGFGPFGMRDMREAVRRGIFRLQPEEIEPSWSLVNWMMVAGIHDVVVGSSPPESVNLVAELIMRQMGATLETAKRASLVPLPNYPPPNINWNVQQRGAISKQK